MRYYELSITGQTGTPNEHISNVSFKIKNDGHAEQLLRGFLHSGFICVIKEVYEPSSKKRANVIEYDDMYDCGEVTSPPSRY